MFVIICRAMTYSAIQIIEVQKQFSGTLAPSLKLNNIGIFKAQKTRKNNSTLLCYSTGQMNSYDGTRPSMTVSKLFELMQIQYGSLI